MTMLSVEHFWFFTYKAGLLSRVGHDLRFSAEVNARLREQRLEVEVNVDRLVLDGHMKDGQLQTGGVSDRDERQIMDNTRDVLQVERFGAVTLSAQVVTRAALSVLQGELILRGVSQPVQVPLKVDSGGAVIRFEIQPSRWGIKPFSALGGTLKLQDRVGFDGRFELQDGDLATTLQGEHQWGPGPH